MLIVYKFFETKLDFDVFNTYKFSKNIAHLNVIEECLINYCATQNEGA